MRTPSTGTLARAFGAALVPCLLAAGCGGGGKTTSTLNTPAVAVTSAKPAVASSAPAPPRLRIVSPAAGAHTGAAVIVRVRLSGGALRGAHPIRYVLDGALNKLGTTALTFHEVAPGRHRLVVLLAGDPRVRASRSFTVLAPAPFAQPASAEPAQAAAPAAPPKAPEAQPTHTTTERMSTERPSKERGSPPPSGEGGIPQGGGGDGDADNSGGPSDGDGNV